MTKSIRSPIAGRNNPYRRGSALMVALALLMLLAVFAALFLTSSRFDQDAATANIDYIRMDLYAEGMAQYVQHCMVAGLWGFDERPLNNDGTNPWTVTAPTVMPGPDSPFDYFGGEVAVDPDGSIGSGTGPNGDEAFFYPSFWLTDPNLRLDGGGDQVFRHAAFSPAPASEVPFNDPGYSNTGAANHWTLQWQYTDLDGDGQADTPWLFVKPIGNGLYIRAAIRVEDTSSRVNLNTADHPLYVEQANNEETLMRSVLYPGYPWLISSTLPATSIFPILSRGAQSTDFANPANNPAWTESVGSFLSEMNLAGLMGSTVATVQQLNNGVGGASASTPGRSGKFVTPAYPVTWPDAPSTNGTPPAVAPGPMIADPLAPLLGNPNSTVDPMRPDPLGGANLAKPTYSFSGRLGDWLCSWYMGAAGNTWSNVNYWPTFDPDGTARRLEAATGFSGLLAPDQDRPFGSDETFDLLSLHGLTVVPATPPYRQEYRAGGSMPVSTRLENLWPVLKDSSAGIQYRRLFTTYSWTWDICPYGEDPSGTAGVVAPGSYRKVNLNTCTAAEFDQAIQAAGRHIVAGTPPSDVDRLSAQLTANLLDYRDRPMTLSELTTYLDWRSWYIATFPGEAVPQPDEVPTTHTGAWATIDHIGWPNAIQLEWDEEQWRTHVSQTTGQPYNSATERAYLVQGTNLPSQWMSAALLPQIAARVSYDSPSIYNNGSVNSVGGAGANGLDRTPFITEVYARINSYDVTAQPSPTVDDRKAAWANAANYFAVELFNPYPDPISIENYRLVIDMPTDDPSGTPLTFEFWRPSFAVNWNNPLMTTVIPPGGYLVVCNAVMDTASQPLYPNAAAVYLQPGLVVYPTSRVRLACGGFIVQDGGASKKRVRDRYVLQDEVPAQVYADLGFVWPPDAPPINSRIDMDMARWDRDGAFWLQNRSGAWSFAQSLTVPGLEVGLGVASGTGPLRLATPRTPFFVVPSIANLTTASFLSPADAMNLLRDGPDEDPVTSGVSPNVALSVKFDNSWNWTPGADDLRLSLFNRSYAPGITDVTSVVNQIANRYSGLAQSLMDFITTNDFTCDGVDNDGHGRIDVSGTTVDMGEMRIPGRLNVNTIADEFLQLDPSVAIPNGVPLLGCINPATNVLALGTANYGFWQVLLAYRDNAGLFAPDRISVALGSTPAGYVSHPGIERLGDLCNVQYKSSATYAGTETFCGFWQTRGSLVGAAGLANVTLGTNGAGLPDYLLPAQHIRGFARNANLLTTRSDTYMVTVRVEIIRPKWQDGLSSGTTDGVMQADEITRIDPFGQREYMYLVDRSFCTQAPQLPPGQSAAVDPFRNAQMNPAFIPPRVWRMSVPNYTGY